ncbi:unnamed protein product [Polarella glacialis]|nr:unnamed protein product [Polarella glacialis]
MSHWMFLKTKRSYPMQAFPVARFGVLRNMVLGRYATSRLGINDTVYGFRPTLHWYSPYLGYGEQWRCTLLLPTKSFQLAWLADMPFEDWRRRPVSIYFRGNPRQVWGRRGDDLRDKAKPLMSVIPGANILGGGKVPAETYAEELQSSKFCLILQSDDPQISRFYDALAAGCIPVVVNDEFLLNAAPFADRLNYLGFALHIPESQFSDFPALVMHLTYNMQEARLRSMLAALLEARQILLWSHPQSRTAAWALSEASHTCSHD